MRKTVNAYEGVFLRNVEIRSRSTNTMPNDEPWELLLDNVLTATRSTISGFSEKSLTASRIRAQAELFYDELSYGFLSPDISYAETLAGLQKEARRLSKITGFHHRVNPRYRTNLICFGVDSIPSGELEFAMDRFYSQLAGRIKMVRNGHMKLPKLLGWTDYMMSAFIRPWDIHPDQNSVVLTAWIAIVTTGHLVRLSEADEAGIADWRLIDYVRYYEKILKK